MKKIIGIIILLIIIGGCGFILHMHKETITELMHVYFTPSKEITIEQTNEYYRNYDFDFVQNTTYFVPDNRQDILNIYYTVLNSGLDTFTFYCPYEYEECLKEVEQLANDQNTLSDINNYVHPYNGFSNIETEYDNIGKVTIKITHNYTQEQIDAINQKIEELIPELVLEENSEYLNIKNIHDYIINNARYDTERKETDNSPYRSDLAYGPLFDGYALCSGYTDLMELFLEKMNIKSYRISSEEHVWNAVYYNYNWLNLDLTWDDPVASDGSDILEQKYFLIDSNELYLLDQEEEKKEHDFNEEHFYELKRK